MKKTTLGRQLHHQQLMPTTAGNLRQSSIPPYPSTFTKFNSALGAGLLNPTSPPLGPTLYQMISSEPDPDPDPPSNDVVSSPLESNILMGNEKQGMAKQRISEILASRGHGTGFDDPDKGNVRVVLSDRDGFRMELSVQRGVLVRNSRFFARELGTKQGMMDGWVGDGDGDGDGEGQFTVEIVDCEDVDVYAETLRLMYCGDLRRTLMKEGVPKVLAILKVSAAIGFDAGVLSCLEYLEAAPWSDDEEEKVSSLLSELHLENTGGVTEVLQRICLDGTVQQNNIDGNKEEALLKLLHVVLEGTDEKARRDMKGLVSKMLRESANHSSDLTNESLYAACDRCLHKLHLHFLLAAKSDLRDVDQISRQADNLLWILDTLFNRQIAGEFLKTWASQSEMSRAHPKVPPLHRFEISRVTARLFVGIGKGQVLASKDVRSLLLQTWLVPFYDDFGWMRRASKGLDRHSVEDGLSNTILTLPLGAQRDVFLAWFDRFLNSGDDCPDIRRGFEVWWRRAFWKRKGDQVAKPHVRIVDVSLYNN